MNSTDNQFLFTTCMPGAEAALKQELAQLDPSLRLAYSRPGFLTWKLLAEEALNDFQLASKNWTFAHAHGFSLGRVSGEQLGPLASQTWQLDGVKQLVAEEHVADIHVWQRGSRFNPRSAQSTREPLAMEVEQSIRAAAPDACAHLRPMSQGPLPQGPRQPSARNGRVLNIVIVEPGEWWIGYHRATKPMQRWPGGVMPIHLPEHAVSRAYAKMEEAILWSSMPMEPGDRCVEIGCSPGGSCQALLDRGLVVTGVDPAKVDDLLLTHPRFTYIRKRGTHLPRRAFRDFQWLTADINMVPSYTLDMVEAIVTHPSVNLQGLILTLKLTNWSLVEQLPAALERVRGWGFRDVRMQQLVSGGQEVCLAALRSRALRRKRQIKRGQKVATNSQEPVSQGPSSQGPVSQRHDRRHPSLQGPHF